MFSDTPYPDRVNLMTYPVDPDTQSKAGQVKVGTEKPNSVTILYFSYYQYSIQTNYAPFCNLPYDCIVTHDGFPNRDHWTNFSAIMLFGKPAFGRMQNIVPGNNTSRDPNQIWVARGMEATIAGSDFIGARRLENWFNFTAALSPKATFRDSYVGVIRRKKREKLSKIEKEYDSYKKDKDFCWMVSNCGATSRRTDMASEIINHLPGNVHMWGRAFPGCMPKVNKTKIINHGFTTRKTVEYEVEMSKCKFYFAFENSICSDYITEKFGNPLALYAIPIVNGWRESYEQILPGSFIHIGDFENNSKLAEYLSHLLGNKDDFFAYHKWRLTHEVLKEERSEMYNLLHCRVCEKVYKTREANKNSLTQVSTISHIGKVFQTMQTCHNKPTNY